MNKKKKLVSTPLAPHFKLSDAISPKNEADENICQDYHTLMLLVA